MNIRKISILITVLGIIILAFARHNYYERIENVGKSAVASSPVAVDSVQEENTDKPIIAFVGDSLTFNGNWEEYFPDVVTYNYGVSGNKSSDVLKRLPEALVNKPDSLFLLVGVNDIWTYTSNEDILSNYAAIIEETKSLSPDTTIYLQSILPVNPQESLKFFPLNPFPEDVADRIQKINSQMKFLAVESDVAFIDLYSRFVDKGNVKEGLTVDGVHLTNSAYEIWIKELENHIN